MIFRHTHTHTHDYSLGGQQEDGSAPKGACHPADSLRLMPEIYMVENGEQTPAGLSADLCMGAMATYHIKKKNVKRKFKLSP